MWQLDHKSRWNGIRKAQACHSYEEPNPSGLLSISSLHKRQVPTLPWCYVHGSIHAAGSASCVMPLA